MFQELIQVVFKNDLNRFNSQFLLACTDAYLTPCLKRYIDTFSNAFETNKLNELNVLFMQSDGGLTPVEKYECKEKDFFLR
jgi:N-methylhydantoinase A/oxoprolinase/acetone carboxylase beta subunit